MKSSRNEARRQQKTLQLCRQAYTVLHNAIAAERDDALLDVSVDSVTPAPDASRLLVTVVARPSQILAVEAALDRAAGRLRAELSQSITRKRAPTLAFRILAHGATEVQS